MTKDDMTMQILAAKKAAGMGWEALAEQVGLGSVFLTSACLGMNSLKPEFADKVCEVLGLSGEVSAALQEFPHKSWDKLVPTDPIILEHLGDAYMKINDREKALEYYNRSLKHQKKDKEKIEKKIQSLTEKGSES